jgi:hypothetical protein
MSLLHLQSVTLSILLCIAIFSFTNLEFFYTYYTGHYTVSQLSHFRASHFRHWLFISKEFSYGPVFFNETLPLTLTDTLIQIPAIVVQNTSFLEVIINAVF